MRVIDADVWFERIDADHCASCNRLFPCSECGLGIARESIENTPTIDTVPVVRCKDCKYSKPIACKHYVICTYGEPYESCSQESDWFCAYGERREE